MKSFAVLLLAIVATTVAQAQAISYNLPAETIKAKKVLLHESASNMSVYLRAHLQTAWPNLMLGKKVDAEALRDTTLLIIQVEPVGKAQQRFVVFQGAKALVESNTGNIPKGSKVLAALTVDTGAVTPELTPTFILALRDMLHLGTDNEDERWAFAMTSDKEWLSRSKPVFIDSLHLKRFFRSERGLGKLEITNVRFADPKVISGIIASGKDARNKGTWVTRQQVTYGKQAYVQTYFFNINNGLVFFIEEPLLEDGSVEIGKAYLTYLFRPVAGVPIKDPDLLEKSSNTVPRQF